MLNGCLSAAITDAELNVRSVEWVVCIDITFFALDYHLFDSHIRDIYMSAFMHSVSRLPS